MTRKENSMNNKLIRDEIYGYLRADPLPTQEEVEKYYKEEFYSSNYQAFNDSSLETKLEELNFFETQYEDIYDICERYFIELKGRTLFEIGFGYGQALDFFHKRGLKVSGLEPAPEGVKYAQDKGFDVVCAGIEDLASVVGSKRHDIVLLLNVLEHLREPAEALIEIREKILKTDGLLIIDVPNEFNDFQCIANEEYALNEWWVVPPNHINYFSVSSLERLFKKCGYEVYYKKASFPMELFLLMGDIYVKDGDLGKACHNKRQRFEQLMCKYGKKEKLNNLYEKFAELELGRQVIMYAYPCK